MTRPNPFARVVYFVATASLVYLALPVVLFAFGWLRLYIAIPTVALLALGVYLCLRSVRRFRIAPRRPGDLFSRRGGLKCVVIFVLVTVWIGLLGTGGYGPMSADYAIRSNRILKDLIFHSWPLLYDGADLRPLCRNDPLRTMPYNGSGWANGVRPEEASVLVSDSCSLLGITVGSHLEFSHSGTRTVRRIALDPDTEQYRVWVTGQPLDPWRDGTPSPIRITRSFEGVNRIALSYPLGYFLPAALVGKALGWAAANHFLFAYTVLGELLGMFWFLALIRRLSILAVVTYIFFSGLDVVGWLILSRRLPAGTEHIEWWAGQGVFAYDANTTYMHWSTHHEVAGLLIGCMLTFFVVRGRDNANSGMLMALCLPWSPLAIGGMVLLAAAGVYKSRIRSFLSFQNLVVAPALLAIFALFFARPPGVMLTGWAWKGFDPYAFGLLLGMFWFLEFGIHAIIASEALRYQPPRMRVLFGLVIVGLLVACLYKVGHWSDLCLRMSLALLDVLVAFIVMACFEFARRGQTGHLKLMICVLAIGSITGLCELSRALAQNHFGYRRPPTEPSFLEWAVPISWGRPQYLWPIDGPFFRYLGRTGSQTGT